MFPVKAQQVKAWIFFTDKPGSHFCASEYFSETNLQRKQAQGLPEYDQYDFPVSNTYIATLQPYCDSITYVSRWLNAACVYTDENRLAQIKEYTFVHSVELTGREPLLMENKTEFKDLHPGEVNLLKAQTNHLQASVFRQNGLTGKNVTIAIIDGGFNGYKKNPVLERARNNGQIKHTYDYIKKREDVDCGSTHGGSVLSCIVGYFDDSLYMGCAPDANVLLYRTEKAFNEKLNEEEYWMAAMEEADRQGADLINTSLGYSTRRYFQEDMNGKKSILARAANIANKKGVLVICSAGNEGDINWKMICTPADADSALAVGAINPWTGVHASWSSYGPSADGRLKPNVCAYGYALTARGSKTVVTNTGTSFSSPLVAGFAACLRQKFPQITAWELMQKVQESGNLYPYFDYVHGYGTPQASKALAENKNNIDPTFEIMLDNDSLKVIIKENVFQPAYLHINGYYTSPNDTLDLYKTVNGEKYRKSFHFNDDTYESTHSDYLYEHEPGYFYYKVNVSEEKRIHEYGILNVHQRMVYQTKRSPHKKVYTFHYKGYTESIEF